MPTLRGISGSGEPVEQRYRELTGAEKPHKTAMGDAQIGQSYVEVKKASAQTLNQVRAVKYIPLVAFHVPTGTWYVVPPHIVVCLVSSKRRGQHTENPFESATINIFALAKYKVASELDLKAATLAAVSEGDKYPDMKLAMARVLDESKQLAIRSLSDVSDLIARLRIVP